jgi:hypothetical protein
MPGSFSFFAPNPAPPSFNPFNPGSTPNHPLSWTLIVTPTIVQPPNAAATASPQLPCPITAFTQADFLSLFSRIFPEGYLAALKNPGPGYEIFQAIGKMMARLSTALANLGCDSFISTSSGGMAAAGNIQLQRGSVLTNGVPLGPKGAAASIVSGAAAGNMRVTGLSGFTANDVGQFLQISDANALTNNGTFQIAAFVSPSTLDVVNAAAVVPDVNNGEISWSEVTFTVTVKAGTIVTTSSGGRSFFTTQDVTFNQNDLGPFTVPVVAVAKGYEWNVPGTVIAGDGTALLGDIDTISTLIENPPLGDPSITVSQAQPTTGGADPALDQHGVDRGIIRNAGEIDAAYRARVRTLPDTISPDAINRNAKQILSPFSANFTVIETWNITFQTCWDAPNTTIPGSNYDPNCFVYDDPRPPTPFRNRWLDENTLRGAFFVLVDNLQPLTDYGMVYDDTAENAQQLQSPVSGGHRAPSAFDVPSAGLNPAEIPGFYDGIDVQKNAVYNTLYQTLQQVKAAGIFATIELSGQ